MRGDEGSPSVVKVPHRQDPEPNAVEFTWGNSGTARVFMPHFQECPICILTIIDVGAVGRIGSH